MRKENAWTGLGSLRGAGLLLLAATA